VEEATIWNLARTTQAKIDEEFRRLVLWAGAEANAAVRTRKIRGPCVCLSPSPENISASADAFRGLRNSSSIFACVVRGQQRPIPRLRLPPRYSFGIQVKWKVALFSPPGPDRFSSRRHRSESWFPHWPNCISARREGPCRWDSLSS